MVDRYECIRCGRPHREGSDAYKLHTQLDPARTPFDADELAVGVAMRHAVSKTIGGKPEASYYEINESFKELGFREQFPSVNLKGQLQQWDDERLIGSGRHGGRDNFIFLSNDWDTKYDWTPGRFHRRMRSILSTYEQKQQR